MATVLRMRVGTAAMLRTRHSPGARRMVWSGASKLPQIKNEPFLHYAPGSAERAALQDELERLDKQASEDPLRVPCIVDGKDVWTGVAVRQPMPHHHEKSICVYDELDEGTVKSAIDGAMRAKTQWASWPQDERNAVFLKAADLLAGKYRQRLNAAVMLGQGKTAWQAEIDAAVETIDFWRFAARWAEHIHAWQPPENSPGVWNRMEYRPLEGFVSCITPFNFIAITANLPSSPVIMGNVALMKPAENATHAAYIVYDILREAGLPDGVIQFLPGNGKIYSEATLTSPDFAAVHFTGSTAVFNQIWRDVGERLDTYKSYPRIVGETGGKNFHVVHHSADLENVLHATIRGAFEYQGQKCSATSRMYVPRSLWPQLRQKLVEQVEKVSMGSPMDFRNFMTAVINERAFMRVQGYIERARASSDAHIICGGVADMSKGYFIAPTIIETTNPHYETMEQEIFGPVLTVYPYDDSVDAEQSFEAVLHLVNQTSGYALTGSIFARDRAAILKASDTLRDAAGNFYINNQSTGSIVSQQPFGGSRRSGTNDKSGSPVNLMRWVSPRSVKESFTGLPGWSYPHMDA
ncbi:Delta-1-pyrroline-5-carboxylate dehydrogenase, mitochondrial [Porphyridium purpureum]|uniref:Multifunctional fusion protein n=1 Tax=Porphyridium purpureum TaxID=35688 RepID=A0A5J4YJZ9_PORPP|nr:Delta-1-pyrroline-5-carboxylate dehydrogenase, mitochondrial [Porphyridium purpureum]|eukprot:POR2521..scf261_15